MEAHAHVGSHTASAKGTRMHLSLLGSDLWSDAIMVLEWIAKLLARNGLRVLVSVYI